MDVFVSLLHTATKYFLRGVGRRRAFTRSVSNSMHLHRTMTEQTVDREELRRRLRAKCGRGRPQASATEETARRLKTDPTGALLAMGIDDAELLRSLPKLIARPEKLLSTVKSTKQRSNKVREVREEGVSEGRPTDAASLGKRVESMPVDAAATSSTSAEGAEQATDSEDDEEAPPPLAP